MGTGLLSASFLTALFASGVRQSIPLIYGSLGDAVSERAGVMGISLEGEMLFGAFFSYLVALRTGSLWLGVLAGALAGMLSSLIVAVWSVLLRQDQSINADLLTNADKFFRAVREDNICISHKYHRNGNCLTELSYKVKYIICRNMVCECADICTLDNRAFCGWI